MVTLAASSEASSKPTDSTARPRPRIESLSDMVFGLALSVGALALVASPPTNSGELYSDLATFGFSFLILIMVWFAYTRLMSVLTFEDHWVVTFNTLLLFTVSVEPFLFNILESRNIAIGFFDAASQAYAIDLGLMMLVLGLFAWAVSLSKQPPLAPGVRRGFREEAVSRWITAGIFFVTVAPVFAEIWIYGQPLRTWLWIVPLVFFGFTRRHREKAQAH